MMKNFRSGYMFFPDALPFMVDAVFADRAAD